MKPTLRKFVIGTGLGLLALAGGASAAEWADRSADSWVIGPIIRSKNYSVGMPLRPSPAQTGWSFDFPYPNANAGHVHYVTFRPGSLTGERIVARYRIEGERGVRFVPREDSAVPATVSLYFQRRGDNWSARGPFEHYRWYAAEATIRRVAVGEYELTARLAPQDWVSIGYQPGTANPAAFEDAIDNVENVGIVFGSTLGRGHGVYSTAPARFTLISFETR